VRKLDGGTTTTLARWHQVHDLLDAGVGLGECARRLNLAPNTVKRYARIDKPERIRRAPQYRPTLVDPYRDHLRKRRAEDPRDPSCSCCAKSANAAMAAARTSSTATSPKAASKTTGQASPPPDTLRPDQQES
jgi:hypothetical protein